jgi:Ni/Co efflux regulator RcnB
MKKILTAAIAATLAMSSLGVASAAEAQTRGNYEQRQDRRDDRRDDRGPRPERAPLDEAASEGGSLPDFLTGPRD